MDIEAIRETVSPLLKKYDMHSARIFSSYACGETDENSDIDILLEGNPGFRPLNIFVFAEELHRISGKETDVFEISELDDGPIREAVLEEAILLFT